MNDIKKLSEDILPFSAFLISRASMPQINDVDKFEEWLEAHVDIDFDRLMVVTDILKPTQHDYDQEKVDKIIANKPEDGVQHKPIVVDEDYFVLDGHHRFLANKQSDEPETWILKVELPINKLLKVAYLYKEHLPDG